MFSSIIKKNYWNPKTFDFNLSPKKVEQIKKPEKKPDKLLPLITGAYFTTFTTIGYIATKE